MDFGEALSLKKRMSTIGPKSAQEFEWLEQFLSVGVYFKWPNEKVPGKKRLYILPLFAVV